MVGEPALDAWIDAGLAQTTPLGTSRASVNAADAATRLARVGRRPSLDAHLDAREGKRKNATTGNRTSDLEPFGMSVTAAWNLDVFGSIRARVGAAKYAELAASHALRDRELDFASDVARHYVETLYRRREARIRADEVAAHEALAVYLRGRVEAGLARPEELEAVEAQRHYAAQQQHAAAEALAALDVRWAYLVPTNGTENLATLSGELTAELPPPPQQDKLHTYAIARPDVQAAYALTMSADHTAAAAARSRLPSLTGMIAAEGDSPSPIDEPEEWRAWAGIRVTLPVLSPERKAAHIVADSQAAVQQALYADVTQLALLDIREAYVRRIHTEKRWSAGQALADQLKARFEAKQRQFEQGLIAVPELERSRLTWLAADESAGALQAATLQHHLDLVRACGGPAQSVMPPDRHSTPEL